MSERCRHGMDNVGCAAVACERGDEGNKTKVGDGQMEDGEEQWSLARLRMSVQIKEGS
jgi:hypothetical protein